MAARGEVFVQFWLKPGEQPVFFDPGNEPPVDPIPKELRRFLSVNAVKIILLKFIFS